VAEPSNTQTVAQGVHLFEGSFCDSISYSLNVDVTDVNVKDFFIAAGTPDAKMEGYRANSVCAPKNDDTDFHLHLSWRVRRGKFNMEIDHVAGKIKRPPEDTEPFAEDFVTWVEKFFLLKKLHARVDLDFTYPTRQSKFPLPLKTAVGPQEIELNIDGISFALANNPEGIEKVWLTQGEKLRAHIMCNRPIDLANLNPKVDMEAVSRVLDTIIEEKSK
jgi:hypothetical protein